jgi:predicted site-specific integrase-resolvase
MCFGDDYSTKKKEISKRNFIYARVSSKKQLDDLHRQVEFIKSREPVKYSTYELITDIASGINFNRKGLDKILDASLFGSIGEVVVAHKDRLSRFGFDLIKLIIEKRGGKIIVLDDEKNKSSDQELAEEFR